VHFFDFVFTHSLGINKKSNENDGAAPGHHFKFHRTDSDEVPAVSEYLSEYLFIYFVQSV
jgi:hypothetical protein